MNWPGAAARWNSTRTSRARVVDDVGMLDHHHRVGAARDHAAGRDQGGGAGLDRQLGSTAGSQHFGVERQDAGPFLRSADRIGGAHGEAIDAGAVESGDVHPGDDIAGQHAAQRRRQRHGLRPDRLELQVAVETGGGLVPADDFQELFLPGRRAQLLSQVGFRHRSPRNFPSCGSRSQQDHRGARQT